MMFEFAQIHRMTLFAALLTSSCCPVGDLQVTTLNVRYATPRDGPDRWKLRRDALGSYLRISGAHLIGLQEVDPDQFRYLQDRLPYHGWIYDEPSRLALAHQLPISTSTVVRIGGSYNRSAIIADVGVTFAVTHLDGYTNSKVGMMKVLERLTDYPKPWIIVGDMNTLPYRLDEWPNRLEALKSRAYEVALDGGLRDVWRDLHPENRTTAYTRHGFEGPPYRSPEEGIDLRIDWILSTEPAKTATIARALTPKGRAISDHWPVSASFSFAK